jgi:hypothetical protein
MKIKLLNPIQYLMGEYDGKTVYFECTMKDLRDPNKKVDIAWIVNSGEVKVDYVPIGLIKNIRAEKLKD